MTMLEAKKKMALLSLPWFKKMQTSSTQKLRPVKQMKHHLNYRGKQQQCENIYPIKGNVGKK